MRAHNTQPITPWMQRALKLLQMLCDMCVCSLGFLLAMHHIQGASQSDKSIHLGLLSLFIGIFYLAIARSHYSTRRPYWTDFGDMVAMCFWAACAHISLMIVLDNNVDKVLLVVVWSITFCALLISRAAFKRVRMMTNTWYLPYILVGDSDNAEAAQAALASEPLLGYRLSTSLSPTQIEASNLDELTRRYANMTWVLALENEDHDTLQQLVHTLDLNANDFIVIPPVRGLPLFSLKPIHVFSQDILLLRGQNRLSQLPSLIFKRCVDIIGSLVLITALSPLLIFVGLLVKRDTGQVLFWHQRMGYAGKPFLCPKFQSMRSGAQAYLDELLANDLDLRNEWEAQFKLRNDPRVTPLGKWLRALSIDELPQLWSVLRGDMSLVGPRPITSEELSLYGSSARHYSQVRPGITGLWQVSGRSETDYATRISLDAWYVKNWSFGLDIVILLKTWGVLLRRKGAW